MADEVIFNFDELLYSFNLIPQLTPKKKSLHVLILGAPNVVAQHHFSKAGYTVETITSPLSEKELCEKVENISILITDRQTKITKKIIDTSKDLRAIGRFGLGTSNIDITYAAEKGISVFNAPSSTSRSVVELVIGSIIMLYRNILPQNDNLHKGIWKQDVANSHELYGKTLGIIGYNTVSSQLAAISKSLGMDVYFYDDDTQTSLVAQTSDSLERLLEIADIITLHIDGTEENNNLLSAHEFEVMKQGVILLNLSRGYVINEKLLAKYITSGKIRGAAIDVFGKEPPASSTLFSSALQPFPNVIMTPHIGGSTEEAIKDSGEFVAQQIISFITNGDTTASVNFPQLQLPKHFTLHRIIHIHKNVPGMLAQINTIYARNNINIEAQYIKTNALIGYIIIDIAKPYKKDFIAELMNIPGTRLVRELY